MVLYGKRFWHLSMWPFLRQMRCSWTSWNSLLSRKSLILQFQIIKKISLQGVPLCWPGYVVKSNAGKPSLFKLPSENWLQLSPTSKYHVIKTSWTSHISLLPVAVKAKYSLFDLGFYRYFKWVLRNGCEGLWSFIQAPNHWRQWWVLVLWQPHDEPVKSDIAKVEWCLVCRENSLAPKQTIPL